MDNDKYESELTRRYLLNSHSRGGLEEVVGEEETMESITGDELSAGPSQPEDYLFMNQWEGNELTKSYFSQSYE
ncbi:hypothetical protein DFP94_11512 [Fontibacillus phaseoli]|uniref:Uncharacterized protein n=1 Tax=Fontibacillus phaseoli TaxID=1416533 RepID=A0A369B1A2_9BACL|nr:hypothetical protein [Fontibacillus phaseoli]RCX15329.1 hypothetical protein DFP94_11512 [Fontibacillus phaseoli]